MAEPVVARQFAIGQSVRRVEDPRLGRDSDAVNLTRRAADDDEVSTPRANRAR